jgi:Tol biopolymer transport system component
MLTARISGRSAPPTPVRSSGFVWSPDGKQVAYPDTGNIYVIEVVAPGGGDSTAAPVNVSTEKAAGSSDIEADWSPASINKLVIRNSQSCAGCSDLYKATADGAGRAQLTTGTGFDASPRWSPAVSSPTRPTAQSWQRLPTP